MKRIISFVLVVVLLSFSFSVSTFAKNTQESITYYADGSYTVITVQDADSVFVKVLQSLRSVKTKTITAKHYNDSNNLEWTASLTGTFSYNGTTASCTNVSKSTTIYASAWKCTSSSCSRSGATATGNFTFKKYTLGIPTQTINETISMTCDKNGNIT